MMIQVHFFHIFFEKDPHFNAVEIINEHKTQGEWKVHSSYTVTD